MNTEGLQGWRFRGSERKGEEGEKGEKRQRREGCVQALGPWESGSISTLKEPQVCHPLQGACLGSPGPEVPIPSADPSWGSTWPGRSGRPGAQGSWHCGYTRPPGCPLGATALPHVPHQRGWEAVAMGQSQGTGVEGLTAAGSARPSRGGQGAGKGRTGGRALGPGAGRAHLSRVGAETLDYVDMTPAGWERASPGHRPAPQLNSPGSNMGALFSPAQLSYEVL